MTKAPTPKYGRGVVHADSATPEQVKRWQDLGGIGHHPATQESIRRAIGYLENQQALSEADRGQCPEMGCTGRRISHMRYVEGRGYLTQWVCNVCGMVRTV